MNGGFEGAVGNRSVERKPFDVRRAFRTIFRAGLARRRFASGGRGRRGIGELASSRRQQSESLTAVNRPGRRVVTGSTKPFPISAVPNCINSKGQLQQWGQLGRTAVDRRQINPRRASSDNRARARESTLASASTRKRCEKPGKSKWTIQQSQAPRSPRRLD